MVKIDGGRILVKCLKQRNIKYLFGLSGEPIQAIFNACIDEDIKIIDTRHEQAAVHMADGWSRTTATPGVAVVTAGVGVVDAVPGMAVSHKSCTPTILISAKFPPEHYDKNYGQDLEQVELLRSITKWAGTCRDIKRIPEYIHFAFHQAITGRPGPVFLDIPSNILETSVEEHTIEYPPFTDTLSPQQANNQSIEAAVEILSRAEKPLIIAGSGVHWSRAGAALQQFVEEAQIPVIMSQMGRGCIPEDHPLCFGAQRTGTRNADVILVLGTRISNWLTYGQPPLFSKNQKWIQVDIEPSEIGWNRHIDIGIVADIRQVLLQMIEAWRKRGAHHSHSSWIQECTSYSAERLIKLQPELNSDQTPVHPLRLCQEIKQFLNRDAIIATDGGDIAIFGTQVLKTYSPGHWLDIGYFGFLGTGIPFGIAAKLAHPDKQVLVLTGDGAFGLNGMEMDTAVRHNLPLTVVVANDACWGMIKRRQQLIYGEERAIGTDLKPTRYEKLVEVFGGYGEFVENASEIKSALEHAFKSNLPACVNVITDPSIASPVTKRSAAGKGA